MKTIIIADKNGQLGNQLFLFAHFISNSFEKNYRLYFPAFKEMSVYFENPSRNFYGEYPIKNWFFESVFLNNICMKTLKLIIAILFRTLPAAKWFRIIRLYKRHDLNIDHKTFFDIETEEEFNNNEKLLLLQGWSFRSPKCIKKYKDLVRPFFHLKKELRDSVDNFITQNKNNCDLLIGVHVRRGDYKGFLNGIYFYDDDTYRKRMLEVKKLFPGKKLRFIITSNEKIAFEEIDGCDIIYSNEIFIKDLYILAGCDYIMGPPSTFSQWASYYGNKPLRILWKAGSEIKKVSEFKVSSLLN
jgi:hypothetical protein